MTLSAASASVPDLLRLVAVPVFAWAAVKDVETRRIPGDVWIPLAALGTVLLVWDGFVAWEAGGLEWTHFVVPTAISLGFVVPLAYLFWWFGGFGGADAKALLVLAILFPVYPQYVLGGVTLPVEPAPIGSFAFTILGNAVVVALVIPIGLALRNALAGRFGAVTFLGWPISVDRIERTHGKLLETSGGTTLDGLDLDALRMYLRWRGATLEELRDDPEQYRDPASLPAVPNPPTDGAVRADGGADDGADRGTDGGGDGGLNGDAAEEIPHDARQPTGEASHDDPEPEPIAIDDDDPWGAAAFLEDIEGTAYGTTPATLREGLEVLVATDRVWITPGTPFLVPIFLGLVLALIYGDLLVALLL